MPLSAWICQIITTFDVFQAWESVLLGGRIALRFQATVAVSCSFAGQVRQMERPLTSLNSYGYSLQ